MRQSIALAAWWSGLVAAHGHLKGYIVDGTSYPAFDPAYDYDPKWNVKRIEYGFAKGKGAVGPVEDVASKDILCRYQPLKEASIEAVARAGAKMSFEWLDWFQSHKGPVITVSERWYDGFPRLLTGCSTWVSCLNRARLKM